MDLRTRFLLFFVHVCRGADRISDMNNIQTMQNAVSLKQVNDELPYGGAGETFVHWGEVGEFKNSTSRRKRMRSKLITTTKTNREIIL